MTVQSLYPDYQGVVRDDPANFHGLMIVYVSWKKHLMFTNPFAFMVPPDMRFGDFVQGVMGPAFSSHPDWPSIDWQQVRWTAHGKPVAIDFDANLEKNGLVHKTALQFETPGLDGLHGQGI